MNNPSLQLVIGNRNYSSWSLRAWLAARASGLDFDEVFIPLNLPETAAQIAEHSPSGLVPVLKLDGHIVWDSLAIIETLNDLAPDAGLWPDKTAPRARARSVTAEMHSGFYRLRRDMPMDLRSDFAGERHTEGALGDANRIQSLWRECREEFGNEGPFLFGAWCAADMMYAPVVGRFRTYGLGNDDPVIRAYMDAVWAQRDMAEWVAAAGVEPYVIDQP